MSLSESAPRRSPFAWFWFAALYVVLTALYAHPLFQAFGTALPNDPGDPALNAWILWWNSKAIPFTAAWWNAPIFFPMTGAFALSETLLSLTPITTPMQWMGSGPVAAYNTVLLLSFPAAALAGHALAYRLTGRHDAALIAGLAFGFSPYRAAQLPHIQLLWSCWMPMCLIGLHGYLRSGRTRDLNFAGVCWTLNALSCGYYLMFFAVLVGFWMLWFVHTRRDWARIGLTFAIASVPLIPLLMGYNRHLAAIGASRGRGEIEGLSADLSAVWAASPHVWLPSHWTMAPRPEGELYPGIVILVLTIVGLVAAWRRSTQSRRLHPKRYVLIAGLVAIVAACVVWLTGGATGQVLGVPISVTRPHRLVGIGIWLVTISLAWDHRLRDGWRRRSIFLFYVLAAAAMLAFALGPVAHVFDARFMDKAPYFWLMQLPGGASLRVPARFSMLFILCLSQTAALAFGRLAGRSGRGVLAGALAACVLADGWVPVFPIAPVRTNIDLAEVDPAAAVIELPMRNLYDDTAAMLRAANHARPLINGFSGYLPPYYGPLQLGMQSFDPAVFDALRQFAPLAVVINRANDEDGRYAAFVRGLPDARLAHETSADAVYTLSRETPAARPFGAQLAVAAVEANDNGTRAAAMLDRDLGTRWETEQPQAPGSEVRVTLREPTAIARIEIDLGGWERTYPRLLIIGVATGDETPRQVWEGGTAGLALLATYREGRRITIAIDLPASTEGRHVFLRSAGSARDDHWSIAEVRLFSPAAVR